MRHLSGRWSKLLYTLIHDPIDAPWKKKKTCEVFMYPLPVSTLKKVSHLHSPIYHLLRLLNKIDIKSMCYLSDIRSFTYTIFNITQTFIRWVVTCRSSLSALVNVYFPDTPFLQSMWFVCHTLLELDKKNFAPILNFSFRGGGGVVKWHNL